MAIVKVYSTPTCPYCKMLKDFLRENKVEFEEIDISADEKAAHELYHKSGQLAVPQTEVDGKIIIGFDREALKKELGL